MDINEAKKILINYEKLNHQRDQLVKIDAEADQQKISQLSRKRVNALSQVYEAEMVLLKADPEFYKQWVGKIVGVPDGWEVKQFVEGFQYRERILQKAIEAREKEQLHGFVTDSVEICKVMYPDIHTEEWRTAIRQMSVLTDEQRSALFQKSDALLSYYNMYEKWTQPIREVPQNLIDVERYISTAYRILWVLPQGLVNGDLSVHSLLRDAMCWSDIEPMSRPLLKLFLASFVVQQYYHYSTDNMAVLNFEHIDKKADRDELLNALKRTAIVNMEKMSRRDLRKLIVTFQPNVIAAPGTLPVVLDALEEPLVSQKDIFFGKNNPYGVVSKFVRHGIDFLQLPALTDDTISIQTWTDDVNAAFRQPCVETNPKCKLPSRPIPPMVDDAPPFYIAVDTMNQTENHKTPKPIEVIQDAIKQHTYLIVDYWDKAENRYMQSRLLPCLLKAHAGIWYMIAQKQGELMGKGQKEDEVSSYRLSDIVRVRPTDEKGNVHDSMVQPYVTSFGVSLIKTQWTSTLTEDYFLYQIQLRVDNRLVNEFLRYPFHFSQELLPKSAADETSRVFQYTTYLTEELVAYIRSFGQDVQVISPDILLKKCRV